MIELTQSGFLTFLEMTAQLNSCELFPLIDYWFICGVDFKFITKFLILTGSFQLDNVLPETKPTHPFHVL